MNLHFLRLRSLKTKITVFTLSIFVGSIWSLALYASWTLHSDMQELLGSQQFSAASSMATGLNDELSLRLSALETVATKVSPTLLANTTDLQAMLEQRPIFQSLFNGGTFFTTADGTATASVPLSAKRSGVNYLFRDHISTALREGKSAISEPVIGKLLQVPVVPVVSMATPVRDANGQVIGALVGVIDLAKPNFMDKITQNSPGKTGEYFVSSRQYRLIVNSTDKTRIMERLPAAGVNPIIDLAIQGDVVAAVYSNARGVEVIGSARGVPVANWFVGTTLSTEEAFAPIHAMKQRMLLAAICLTLLAGIMIWQILKRQLSPMLTAARTLAALSDSGQSPPPLLIASQDEIGDLLSSFNRLLEALGKRERAVCESESRYQRAVNGVNDGIWEWIPATGEDYLSPRSKQLLGYEDHELPNVQESFFGQIHPDDQTRAAQAMQAHLEEHQPYAIDLRLRHKNGEYRWFSARGQAIWDEHGQPLRMAGFITDITLQKRAQEALRKSDERMKSFFENISIGIFTSTREGKFTYVNPALPAMLGYSSSEDLMCEVNRTSIAEALYVDIARREAIIQELDASPFDCHSSENRYRCKDGRIIHAVLTIRKESASPAGERLYYGIVNDITERKQAEIALQRSEQRLRSVFETMSEGFSIQEVICDDAGKPRDLRFLDANQAFERQTGLKNADILGHTLLELFPQTETLWIERYGKVGLTGEPTHFEATFGPLNKHYRVNAFQTDTAQFGVMFTDIHEYKQAAEVLRESEQRYRAVTQSANDAIITINSSGAIVGWNHCAELVFGYHEAEIQGRPLTLLIPEPFREKHLAGMGRILAGGSASMLGRAVEKEGLRKDGTVFPMELSVAQWQVGDDRFYTGTIRDITERRRASEALRIAAIAFDSQEGMFISDSAGAIIRVNRAFSEITGFSSREAIGETAALLGSDRHDAYFYVALWDSVLCSGSWKGDFWSQRKNGELYPGYLTMTAVRNEAGDVTNYVGTLTDITLRKAAEDEIEQLAFFDTLTQLPNRRLLIDRLKRALVSSARSKKIGALLFIDLDNFKTLNDTLGHDIGDLLLQQVAVRLTGCVRESDTVARLGGDEFVVMLEDLSENAQDAAAQARIVGQKVLNSLTQPYRLSSYEQHSTPSIGITLLTDQQGTIDDLLKQADLAMYQAKASGRNTLRFFDPEMQAVVSIRAALEADLREAILKAEFSLHYQIQVDSASRPTGAEALLRWQHPQRGMVPPARFIAVAEDTGLILSLGQWVLEAACKQLAGWASQPEMAHLTVAVNVSARQFHHRDFVRQVMTVLDQTGARPHLLKLELTESMMVADVEDVIAKMTALKAAGVGFSLDDFGTGYSSLSYLKRLPLDQLKIDQSFVRDILTDANDAAIAKMIVALAESMGLAVIAEGVESQEQRDFLGRQGCHAYQGYFFGRPMPLARFEESVMQHYSLGTCAK